MSEVAQLRDPPFSPQTLAVRWKCTPAHIYSLIRKGGLKPFHLGGRLIRISAEEVLKWEAGQNESAGYDEIREWRKRNPIKKKDAA